MISARVVFYVYDYGLRARIGVRVMGHTVDGLVLELGF